MAVLAKERERRMLGLSPTPVKQPAAGAAVGLPPLGAASLADALDTTIDGIAWTATPEFATQLEYVTGRSWQAPDAAGWDCVKSNADRSVFRMQIANSGYFIKYYRERGTRMLLRRILRGGIAGREWACGRYAARYDLPAVRPVGFADDVTWAGERCSVLVLEEFERSRPLSRYWLQLLSDADVFAEQSALLERLAELIAHAHQAGFEHRDLHPSNILVQVSGAAPPRVVLADLYNARCGRPLGLRAVARNLAQLNQWFMTRSSLAQRLRFVRAYLRWRNEYEVIHAHTGAGLQIEYRALLDELDDATRRHSDALFRKRDRRTLKSSKYFGKLVLPGGWRAQVFRCAKRMRGESPLAGGALSDEWWRSQLRDFSTWGRGSTEPVAKDSHSAEVARVMLDQAEPRVEVVRKRIRSRNWRRSLRNLLFRSRNRRGWLVGNALLHRDLPTARPLALLERRLGPLVLESVLLTEAIGAACDLRAYLEEQHARLRGAAWLRCRQDVAALLAHRLRSLHARGFVHRDCKLDNVLAVRRGELDLWWIDLDGLRVRRPNWRDEARALVRLWVSALDSGLATRTDAARFLRSYCGRFGAPRGQWKAAWHELTEAVRAKQAARNKRRAWKRRVYGRE